MVVLQKKGKRAQTGWRRMGWPPPPSLSIKIIKITNLEITPVDTLCCDVAVTDSFGEKKEVLKEKVPPPFSDRKAGRLEERGKRKKRKKIAY